MFKTIKKNSIHMSFNVFIYQLSSLIFYAIVTVIGELQYIFSHTLFILNCQYYSRTFLKSFVGALEHDYQMERL